MAREDDLYRALERLDRRPYPAYKDLGGRRFGVGPYVFRLVHVQGDPFARPSRLEVRAGPEVCRLPPPALAHPDARRATADLLHRAVRRALAGVEQGGERGGERGGDGPGETGRGGPGGRGRGYGGRGGRGGHGGRGGGGSGKSGLLSIAPVGPEVLDRTGCVLSPAGEVRLIIEVGLPAQGRRIMGRAAASLLAETLPRALDAALVGLDLSRVRRWVEAVEDQVALRAALAARGLVAFLADGAVLPRRSGVDPRPLIDAVPLVAPDALAVTLEAPHAGRLRGLGVPEGVTLITGGGYHGKSTLLAALAHGVYDHAPDDGRERCVTRAEAVTIRAEDGRAVRAVDLRPFIGALPGGRRTDRFDTDDASGSTSQAAAIVEALEAGARALLIDEDTAATNFMIRDARMRRLIPPGKEPITPFIDRVRQLYAERGVSAVLVVGGAGDYLDVADRVIRMSDYRPHDVTAEARQIAAALPLGEAAPVAPDPWPTPAPRVPDPGGLDPSRGRRRARVRSVKTRAIEFGEDEIDVSLVGQLVDPAQARAIGDALLLLSRGVVDGRRSVAEVLDALDERVAARGLAMICGDGVGDRAAPRRFEIAAALNRLRSLKIR